MTGRAGSPIEHGEGNFNHVKIRKGAPGSGTTRLALMRELKIFTEDNCDG
jgi:hypothetical protein